MLGGASRQNRRWLRADVYVRDWLEKRFATVRLVDDVDGPPVHKSQLCSNESIANPLVCDCHTVWPAHAGLRQQYSSQDLVAIGLEAVANLPAGGLERDTNLPREIQ